MPTSDSVSGGWSGTGRHGCARLVMRGRPVESVLDAVVLVDKPQGWTSTDVVRRIRQISGTRKVGHAGTLDPMATGLLICMTGRCTRLSRHFLEMEKEYVGTMRLGETTPSYDADTPVERRTPATHIEQDELELLAAGREGEVVQQTPPYSAVKVSGERLYHRARRGDRRSGPPRVVTIHRFEVTGKRDCDVDFRLVCSKGTYVRALAHDIGQELGVGAHLVRLRRTRIGEHQVADAIGVEDVEALARASEEESDRGRGEHAS